MTFLKFMAMLLVGMFIWYALPTLAMIGFSDLGIWALPAIFVTISGSWWLFGKWIFK